MKLETVAESFAGYAARVIPKNAPPVQILECKRAFFAGAYYLLCGALWRLGDPSTSDEDGVAELQAIKREVEAFAGGSIDEVETPAAAAAGGSTRIEVASILGVKSNRGLVELMIDDVTAQMELAKAREVVGMLQSAIEAAVSDELLFQFLTTKLHLPPHLVGAALLEFRELRQGSRDTVYPQ